MRRCAHTDMRVLVQRDDDDHLWRSVVCDAFVLSITSLSTY
jgi:hypothetical protein